MQLRNWTVKCKTTVPCYPAEKANCKCRQISIAHGLKICKHRFPVITPTMAFRRDKDGLVQASVSTMVTSEIVLILDNEYETNILVSNAVLSGCYNWRRRERRRVSSGTASRLAQAEIVCSDASFVVPCNVDGVESLLRFSFTKARINSRCSVSCGPVLSTFEIGGILKFTHSVEGMISSWIEGRTNSFQDIEFPDVFHIANVFTQWYKTLLLATGALALAIIVTYISIWTWGPKILLGVLRLIAATVRLFFRTCLRVLLVLSKSFRTMHEKMAERDVDSDIAYLSNLMLHRHTALTRVHEDLNVIEEAFHREISVASMIQLQWSYIVTDQTFILGTPGDRIRTLAKQMKDLILTRERFSRMATRYIYTNRYYKELAVSWKITMNQKEWDSKAEGILLQLDKNATAEKDFNAGPCHTNAQHINQLFRKAFDNLKSTERGDTEKRFEELQKKITEQAAEISRLKERIQQPNPETGPCAPEGEMTDDAYWSRMVEEIHDIQEDNQPQTPPPLASDGDDDDEQMEDQPIPEADNDKRTAEEPLVITPANTGVRVVQLVLPETDDRVPERVPREAAETIDIRVPAQELPEVPEDRRDRVVEDVPLKKSRGSEDHEDREAHDRVSSPETDPRPQSTDTSADSDPLGEHAMLYRRRNADELRRLIEEVQKDIEKMESIQELRDLLGELAAVTMERQREIERRHHDRSRSERRRQNDDRSRSAGRRQDDDRSRSERRRQNDDRSRSAGRRQDDDRSRSADERQDHDSRREETPKNIERGPTGAGGFKSGWKKDN
ncbi:hypothetical protein COOONC_01231 [Cooperia oncophora]